MNHKFTRAAALVELDGEVLMLKLSTSAWQEVLAIAARENGGQLSAAAVPNQRVLDDINEPQN